MDDPDIAVLRQKEQHLTATDYAGALRERLPDRDVAVARTPEEERELLRRASVATGPTVDESALRRAENLDLFVCRYAGTDHLPLDAFEAAGVAVTTAAGVHGTNVSEYVLGALLSFTNRFHRAWRRAERGEWRAFPTGELEGSTVAVVGLGAIGRTVVERLEPFGVETVGVRYTPEKGGPAGEVVGYDEFHAALAGADHLVVACPLSGETRGLVDADALATLPPTAVVVNVGRGPVVDTDELVAALRRNAIQGAALDVTDPEPLPPEHPLWTFENVLLTPHVAGHTPAYFERLADVLAENVRRLDEGRPLRNRVV